MPSIDTVTVVSPQFIGSLAVLSGGCWVLLLRRIHRSSRDHRRVRTSLLAMLSLLLTLSAVASGVNAYYSYLPKLQDLVDVVASTPPPDASKVLNRPDPPHSRGEIVRLSVPDNGSGFGKSGALVWLPPQYFANSSERFPTVYLFHGSPGVAKDWFRGGEAADIGLSLARAGHPAVLVAARMSKGWLDDPECVDGIHEKIETHLLRDVLPTVDASVRTIADRNDRIFAGMSAGGYCALNLGLRNRSEVSTILDLSGYTAPTHSGGLKALFGQSGSVAAAANTPSLYARTLPAAPAMRIWMDSGSQDKDVLKEMRTLAPVLQSRGMTVELHVRPGAHTFSVWRPALRDSLSWALSQPVPTVSAGGFGQPAG